MNTVVNVTVHLQWDKWATAIGTPVKIFIRTKTVFFGWRLMISDKFLPRDASAERGDATVSCPSVCPSVCL